MCKVTCHLKGIFSQTEKQHQRVKGLGLPFTPGVYVHKKLHMRSSVRPPAQHVLLTCIGLEFLCSGAALFRLALFANACCKCQKPFQEHPALHLLQG